jgi:hypothetical protein
MILKLTRPDDKANYIITNQISRFTDNPDSDGTLIIVGGEHIVVKETCADILQMILQGTK